MKKSKLSLIMLIIVSFISITSIAFCNSVPVVDGDNDSKPLTISFEFIKVNQSQKVLFKEGESLAIPIVSVFNGHEYKIKMIEDDSRKSEKDKFGINFSVIPDINVNDNTIKLKIKSVVKFSEKLSNLTEATIQCKSGKRCYHDLL